MKRILLASAGALLLATSAAAQTQLGPTVPTGTAGAPNSKTVTVQGIAGATPLPTSGYATSYQMLGTYGGAGSAATGASTARGPLYAERAYTLGCVGTLPSGDTIQAQSLAPDGVTWASVGSAYTTLPFTFAFTIGSVSDLTSPPANFRVYVSGTAAPTLWCRLG